MGGKASTPIFVGSAIASVFGTIILIKDSFGGKPFEGVVPMEGKVVIITGANGGIGRETTLDFAKRKATVIMACRNIERCEEAREKIVLETLNKHVYCRRCDLASQSSIRKFAERFKKEHQRLDILINNAGIMRCPLSKTEEGIELQLGVNYMGPFLLTNLLLDRLKESAPSRIVNVTSLTFKRGVINKEDINSEKSYDDSDAFDQSQLANVLFTRQLAKRLKGTGVTVNAVYPGIANTEINKHLGYYNSTVASIFVKPFFWMLSKPPRQAAQNIIHMSLSPDLDRVSGKFFSHCSESGLSRQAEDDRLAKWLWLVSEKWTRLKS